MRISTEKKQIINLKAIVSTYLFNCETRAK